jgi:hypothetical protein
MRNLTQRRQGAEEKKIATKERKERKKSREQSAKMNSRYRWIMLLMANFDALSSDA